MNFYARLELALLSDSVSYKAECVEECLHNCSEKRVEMEEGFSPRHFEAPSYAKRCRIVLPRDLPNRKDFDTPEGLATLVHAITHIEYSAIDLALDAVYRFVEMPLEYKCDWLEVAADEIRHFGMLEELLTDLGYRYGDFPVHSGLFEAAGQTAGDILDRMAVIPRYYEASGLDVNPQIVKKLHNKRKLPEVGRMIEALEVIYREEIDHVRKGDKWFRWLCGERGVDAEDAYMAILERYRMTGKHRPHLNVAARREAGFACSELLKLGAAECT
jgi:uncharacterized ferritin-like protein (DUF455 family)